MTFKINIAIALVALLCAIFIYSCGGDSSEPSQTQPSPTAQPAPTTPPVPVASSPAPSAPSPASVRTAIQIPTPTPVAVASPPTLPTPTLLPTVPPPTPPIPTPSPPPLLPTPEPISATGECLSDGSLTDPELIIACSEEAMRQLQSVVVRVRIDLAAMFAGPGTAGPASVMEMEIARVMPDDMNAVMTDPDGQEIRVIETGGDSYTNDPMSGGWVKVDEIQAEISEMFLMGSNFEGQFLNPEAGPVEWNEVSISEDGAKYALSFRLTDAEATLTLDPALEFRVTLDAVAFLHDSVIVVAVDAEGVERNIFEIEYDQHNEPFQIEAPSEYVEAGSTSTPSGGASE